MPRRSIAGQMPPLEPVDAMPGALAKRPGKAKRNRDWEQAHKVAAYRGIPPELQARLIEIARAQAVPVGDVARALLEAGLEQYDRGALALQAVPLAVKNTLYPA
jgi:hypothetical protein